MNLLKKALKAVNRFVDEFVGDYFSGEIEENGWIKIDGWYINPYQPMP